MKVILRHRLGRNGEWSNVIISLENKFDGTQYFSIWYEYPNCVDYRCSHNDINSVIESFENIIGHKLQDKLKELLYRSFK